MPDLITLEEDGPLGKAGTQVWVNDPAPGKHEAVEKKAPAKKQAAKS